MEHNPDQPFNSKESNSSEFEYNPQKFEKTPFFKKSYNDESQSSNTYYKKTFSNDQRNSYNDQRGGYNDQKSGGYNKKPFNNKTGQGGFKKPFVKKPEFIKEQRGIGAGIYFKLVPVITEQRGTGAGTYTKKLNVPAGYNDNPDRKPKPRREQTEHKIVPVYTDAPILSNEREEAEGMRVNKFIAHAGICARRKADEYIKSGRVTINGEKNGPSGLSRKS